MKTNECLKFLEKGDVVKIKLKKYCNDRIGFYSDNAIFQYNYNGFIEVILNGGSRVYEIDIDFIDKIEKIIMKPTIKMFNKNDFLIEEFRNGFIGYNKRISYLHKDIPIWFEFDTEEDILYQVDEYGNKFELKDEKEVHNILSIFKIKL